LTDHISAPIIYSRGTTGISHDIKKHDPADTLFEICKDGELEVFLSGVKE
jgi:HD superfamily phosphohydrolase YqeK